MSEVESKTPEEAAVLGWGKISAFLGGVTLIGSVVDFLKPLGWSLIWLLVLLIVALVLVMLQPKAVFQRIPAKYWKPAHQTPSMIGLLLSVLIVGYAYAHSDGPGGFLAGAAAPIGDVQSQLLGLAQRTAEDSAAARVNTETIIKEMKRETSDDPQKELQNRGIAWTEDAFMEAVRRGDLKTVDLFLQGGMNPEIAQSEGRPLHVMLSLNEYNPAEMLDLLLAGGLDINHVYVVSSGLMDVRSTLLGRAIEKGNAPLAKAIIKKKAKINEPIQTFGAFGSAVDSYPLVSAIYWDKFDIADALLDAGADVSVGDYLPFRQANEKLKRVRPEDRAALDAIIRRTAPKGAAAGRIADEERLLEVRNELNKVALEALRAPYGSSQKAKLDARYDELQVERQALMKKLGVTDD